MIFHPKSWHRLPRLVVLGLCALLPGAALFAEEESASESPNEPYLVEGGEVRVEGKLPYVPTSNTVAAKLPLSLDRTPASVTVVPTALFGEQGGAVLGDALENASGLNVQTGSGVFDFFVVRGLDSVSSGLILTDGAPEPETTFYQLYNVERAEVYRGPTAFLYGGSPLGGTVNLVRKQPLPASFARVGIGAGSFGTFEGNIDANRASADGEWSFRLNGLWRETDGFRDDKAMETRSFNPALTWRPREDVSVNFNLERLEIDGESDAGLPLIFDGRGGASLAPVPFERSYQSPIDLSEQVIDRGQVDIEKRFGSRFLLRDKAYYRNLDWDSRGTVFNGVLADVTGDLAISRTMLILDDEQTLIGNQLEGIAELTTGGVEHSLLVGLELSQLEDQFFFDARLLPNISVFAPVETSPTSADQLFPLPGQARNVDARSRVVAPYIVDQMRFGERFELLLGVRFDRIDFEDNASGAEREDDEVSPMIGAVFAATPKVVLYANGGEAFAPPSTFATDPNRVPEESRQVEAGVRFSGAWAGSLAIFRLDRENIAIPVGFGVERQVGDQQSEGLEVEVGGEIAPGTRLHLAYAYTESELTRFSELLFLGPAFPPLLLDHSGNRAPFAPEHLAKVWLSHRWDNGFGIAGGGRYTGEQFIDEDNVFTVGDSFRLDLSASWERGPWRLRLNLDNVTDEEILTRGFSNTSVIPAPGFAASTAIDYRF
ncbi:MAG: TonB-dependent siderophore receptor [Acidobacteriota bacterium]